MSPLADRRAHLRYEVVGVLRGTLELSEAVGVQNISGSGVLIETSIPVTVGTTQAIQMTLDGRSARVLSRVRHVTAVGQTPAPRYAVGLEFVSQSDALSASLANLIADRKTEPDPTSGV